MKPEEIAKKYRIDLKKLEQEQKKLAKTIKTEDKIDFKLADKIGAIDNSFFENKIISAILVVNPEMEIIEQEYYSDKLKFPYISGFRAYRELPTMIEAFNKLEERPDVIFVAGHGIAHPRLGLASHFSISTGVPTIGVANSLIKGEVKGQDIILEGKKVGKTLISKPGSKPMYISPGNSISIKTAYEISQKLIQLPHKLPEPLHMAHKYSKDIRKEVYGSFKKNE